MRARAHIRRPQRVGDSAWTRAVLIGLGLTGAVLMLGAPVALVLVRAFAEGLGVYWSKVSDPFTLKAIGLTVLTAVVVTPVNTVFGLCAAWAVTHHRFPGRQLLTTLIEAPISISPIVAGVALLFLYGAQGVLGPWLVAHGWRLMFTVPAIFLASLFVTSPFVARTLITAMAAMERDDEEAAILLGASGPTMFWRITLPKIGLPLIYGDTGGEVVIIASKGGADVHPAWYLNITAGGPVAFQIGGQAFSATWREPQGAEYAEVWAFMAKLYPPYTAYQAGTSRKIPIVMLKADKAIERFKG